MRIIFDIITCGYCERDGGNKYRQLACALLLKYSGTEL